MSLPASSIRRPVTTLMVYIGVILFGVISFSLLSQELFPPINYPQLSIVSRYENAAPEEIETLITKPIEEAIGGISGIRKITSTSKEGMSLVIAEFGWKQKMEFASLAIREKIDLIKERLPRDAEEPVVIKFNPFEKATMEVSIASDKRTPVQLRELVRKWFKDEIEKLNGVASASISGGAEEQILVNVSSTRLQRAGVSITELTEAIAAANLNYPGGTIKESFYEYLIRTMGEFKHVSEIGQIPIRRENLKTSKNPYYEEMNSKEPSNRLVLLKDVADIERTVKKRTSFSRYNSVENVTLSIQKQALANTVQVNNAIKKKLKELKEQLPKDLRIDVVSDESKSVVNALQGVGDAAWQGGLLAFLVLLIFLKDFKSSLLVVTITPVTVLATFALMFFLNATFGQRLSLNVISLGGLALGVGMLLDNAVVVIENVYRKYRDNPKMGIANAATDGCTEVIAPMWASTMTTVCVFLPIMFVTGIAGQLFKELALVVVVTQVISAFVAFTLLPMSIAKVGGKSELTKRDIHESNAEGPGKLTDRSQEIVIQKSFSRRLHLVLDILARPIGAIEKAYEKVLPVFIERKWFYLAIVVALFVGSLYILGSLDRVLLPKIDQGEFTVKIDLPVGSRVEFTNEIAKKIENYLEQVPDVKSISSIVGSSRGDSTKEIIERLGAHQAQIIVNLKDERKHSTNEIVQDIREYFELSKNRASIRPARINYMLHDTAFGVGEAENDAPIVIEIKGPDLEQLKRLANLTEKKIAQIDGIYGVSDSISEPFPETKATVNKDRASFYKLSVLSVAQAANIAIKGAVASKFKEEGREIDIRVQMNEKDRDDIKKLRILTVHSPLDLELPLSDFVQFKKGKGPSEIKRVSQERTVLVFAKVYGREFKDSVADVQSAVDRLEKPTKYEIKIAGESKEVQESFKSLQFAFLLSIVLVYMIMAAQFESLWQPFIIMFCLPLSLIGVAFSLWISHTPLSVVAILGIILLGGIVVNNGIILIDFVNQLKNEGMPLKVAVIKAGKVRLRPILMTAFSSAVGAFPLALGTGETALQAPLGITAMGGILIATFLTLLVIPAVYVGANEIAQKFKRSKPAPFPRN